MCLSGSCENCTKQSNAHLVSSDAWCIKVPSCLLFSEPKKLESLMVNNVKMKMALSTNNVTWIDSSNLTSSQGKKSKYSLCFVSTQILEQSVFPYSLLLQQYVLVISFYSTIGTSSYYQNFILNLYWRVQLAKQNI
jgi:hypothetical protein